MGQRLAPSNLGLSPWEQLNDAQKAISTGDILLFSDRNYYGRVVRYTNQSMWSHVGIAIKSSRLLSEVYVLEVAIDRESLYHLTHNHNHHKTCENDENDENDENAVKSQSQSERTIKFGMQITPLRSLLYSEKYDLVAYRRLHWSKQLNQSDRESSMHEISSLRNRSNNPHTPSHASQKDDAGNLHRHHQMQQHSIDESHDDYLTSKLLSLITDHHMMQITISDDKWREIYGTMFNNDVIHCATAEDLKCLASAECMAAIYFKLGIFSSAASSAFSKSSDESDGGNGTGGDGGGNYRDGYYHNRDHSLISRFVPTHFGSASPYLLPLNTKLVSHIGTEHFIYSDFQVWLSTVQIPGMPTVVPSLEDGDMNRDDQEVNNGDGDRPKKQKIFAKNNHFIWLRTIAPPPIEMSLIQTFKTGRRAIENLKLRNGDLLFFRDETPIGKSALRLQGGNYSRVAMVVRLPGISNVFLLDASSWYLDQADIAECKSKTLQQRLQTLESVLMSGAFSRVAIRRLIKGSLTKNTLSTDLFLSLHVLGNEDELVWKRIKFLFEGLGKNYGPLWRFDVSCIFSGCFVALAYAQLGLLPLADFNLEKAIMMTPTVWETQMLVDGYRLGDEELIHGRKLNE